MIVNYKIDRESILQCYHCGESCKTEALYFDDKNFCCDGCKLVYDLLKENSLCTYYNLNEKPGISPGKMQYSGKYDFLDNAEVMDKLIRFKEGNQIHIVFFIPKMHCSSCIWLLESLHKMNKGVFSSTVNFLRKEANIVFNLDEIKLSELASLLAHIGYEPLINQGSLEKKTESKINKNQIIKIGIAGFCFGNIMMLSFPEYFSLGNFQDQANLKFLFGYLNLFLSLPVFFYSAFGFFESAWKSLRQRFLNIDAPIALAILVTFLRSAYEIISHTGSGYMDSMAGIVFFMLLGRYFQNKTYDTLSFERDYKSFFPVGVTVKKANGLEVNLPVSDLKKGDSVIIRNNEIIPSDAILLSKQTHIDYSFITGESAPIKREVGALIYAGGKQLDGAIELEIVKPASQSYLTQLWNNNPQEQEKLKINRSFIDRINKYFTITVLLISAISSAFWLYNDSSKALNALTAVLIVACPCGLLLTSTFANGNLLRIFGRNKFYLKNSSVIEKITKINTILFDKTGTITHGSTVSFFGNTLNEYDLQMVTTLASQSSHPLSRKIYSQFSKCPIFEIKDFEEVPGMGIKALVDGKYILLGSEYFITGRSSTDMNLSGKVFLMIEGVIFGYFGFKSTFRTELRTLIQKLSKKYKLQMLSGDNEAERSGLEIVFGKSSPLYFNQKPEDKMQHVLNLQQNGMNVMMIGDGLNDAAALRQSDVGLAVSDDTNNFSPACDAIIHGSEFNKLPLFFSLAKSGKKVIVITFAISLIYNVIGLLFAVQGILSPVVAAILMPISSVSIVLISTLSTEIIARMKGL